MQVTPQPSRVARQLLSLLAAERPARAGGVTPVDALAERLSLDVARFHPAGRRAGTLGWLEPGERLIYVREGLAEASRRFTLAHEIGHAVLHRPGGAEGLIARTPLAYIEGGEQWPPECDGADLDTPLDSLSSEDELLRPGQAYSGRAQRESEANAFAAELLLPSDALLAAYRAGDVSDTHGGRRRVDLRALAERFGVSEEVLLRRLAGLLAPREPDEEESAQVEAVGPFAPPAAGRLDPWQRAAAETPAPALVVAGPGTGKTSTLVGRVAHLVEREGAAPGGILALTFSNKAAREMRARVGALLGQRNAGETGGPDQPAISTIHAFCGDLLRRYAPLVGLRPDFRLIGETEGYFLLRRIATDLALSHYQPLAAPALHFPTLLKAISRAKDELAGPERYADAARSLTRGAGSEEERAAAERALEVARVYTAYQAELDARGDPDFGDLIRLSVRLLREHADVLAQVRHQYRHVLVDEFQDINRAMGVLLRTLAGSDGPLWAVGDADQAIYRFRGASPANLSRFGADYPDARVLALRGNYRSVSDVLAAATAIAGAFLPGGERAPLEAARPTPADAAPITLAAAADEAAELAGLARAIAARAAAGRPLGEQVVLCRTRRQGERVAAALSAAGIPTHTATPLAQQDDVKDLLAIVALLADGSGTGLLRAGNFPDHAFTQEEARAILAEARRRQLAPLALLSDDPLDIASLTGVTPEGAEGLRALSATLHDLRQAPDVVTGLARYAFGLSGLGGRLLGLGGAANGAPGEARDDTTAARAHLAQILAFARAFEDQRRAERARDAAGPANVRHDRADWAGFLDYIRVVAALRQDGVGAGDETPGATVDGVRVLTVHASKGLEFPVVYLPGLADRRFPMQRHGEPAPLLPGISEDEEAEARDPRAHLAEEACLFYVALTRARDELVLSYAERYGRMRYRPSPFLEPIAASLGERLTHTRWLDRPVVRAETPLHATATIPARGRDMPGVERARMPEGPVRQSEIETFERCPRQYAYRYVYGLRPREIGLATLRRALHDTLHALQERLTVADSTEPNGRSSLEEALGLFDDHWASALRRELRPGGEMVADADPIELPPGSFVEVYRRHGRHVVERVWAGLVRADETEKAADAAARPPQPELPEQPDGVEYDHSVTVRVGRHDVAVLLDRVEQVERVSEPAGVGAGAGSSRRGSGRSLGGNGAQPVRFVRHRLGRSAARGPDLRALLYTLAAEQRAAGAPAELLQHNLSTGEIERLTLNDRARARLRDELADVLDGMASGYYPAKPDPNVCPSCPFLLVCPA